jgi:hypothetical protein
VRFLRAGSVVLGERVFALPSASGLRVTRHPGTGAAGELAVTVREPVEKKAAERKIPRARFAEASARLTQANLLKTEPWWCKRWLAMLRMGSMCDTPSLKGLTFASVG